jgi:hypothetical protein
MAFLPINLPPLGVGGEEMDTAVMIGCAPWKTKTFLSLAALETQSTQRKPKYWSKYKTPGLE